MTKPQTIAQLQSIINHLRRSDTQDGIIKELRAALSNKDNTPAHIETLQWQIRFAETRNVAFMENYAKELSKFIADTGIEIEVREEPAY